jgi:methylenetetrahydrofolate--tRNA-(uracil-5-)-methyltransferase
VKIIVIGAGLAGCEAANYISKFAKVTLYEMKPLKYTPAHHSEFFSELVCSNSLKNKSITNASGLLKKEMELFDSLIMEAAYKTAVPAGDALSVDRDLFAKYITEKIQNNPNIQVIHEEIETIPNDAYVIIASGPLTSAGLTKNIQNLLGDDGLYFYDASAPLIHIDGIDLNKCYYKARYDHGSPDYLNCPFTKDEFYHFYNELINAQRVPLKDFEKNFEGCLPIEVIAKRGPKTLTFGPLKPVGLNKGNQPYAVVQLRQDNINTDLFNIVGFQTNLTYSEQNRVFHLIPGLENAKFYRYGLMHRNTYIKSPLYLNNTLNLKSNPNIFFAGQITGVEGYLESAFTGIIAGINALRSSLDKPLLSLPLPTMIGSIINYITASSLKNFAPMNANYGVLISQTKDKEQIAENSLKILLEWKTNI